MMSGYYYSCLFVFYIDIVLWLFLLGSLVVLKGGLICFISSVFCFSSDFSSVYLL